MNNLIEQIKKGQEELQLDLEANLLDGDKLHDCGNAVISAPAILDWATQWHTSFLISLLEGERERLKSTYKSPLDLDKPVCDNLSCGACSAYNEAVTDQISHIDEALAYLKTNV